MSVRGEQSPTVGQQGSGPPVQIVSNPAIETRESHKCEKFGFIANRTDFFVLEPNERECSRGCLHATGVVYAEKSLKGHV